MTSTPQPNAGDKVYSMPRGRILGGSSGINYLMVRLMAFIPFPCPGPRMAVILRRYSFRQL